jgi:polyhydroxyalkanoate synthesis regulator phasin
MDELQKLIGCGNTWAEEKAATAIELATIHGNGEISDDEYKELLQDLIRTDAISDDAKDIEFKSMLIAGVSGLLQVL